MTNSERKILHEFVSGGLAIIFDRLKDNTRYIEVCEQQNNSEQVADALLHKLEKDERITIRRHYEGEVVKTGIEIDEAYLQALYDGEIFPDELIIPQDPDYRPTHKKISEEKEYRKQKLTEEAYKWLEEIDNLFCQATSMSASEVFSYGFKLGGNTLD